VTGVAGVQELQNRKAAFKFVPGWFFVPKGQEDSAQGFNPGNRTPSATRPVRAQDRECDGNKNVLCLTTWLIPRPSLGPHCFL
jgi:hypothetical protein